MTAKLTNALDDIKESDRLRHRAILRVILYTAIPTATFFLVLNISNGFYPIAFFDGIIIATSFVLLAVSKTTVHIQKISLVFTLICFSVILLAGTYKDSPYQILLWVFVIPVIAYSTFGRKYGFIASAFFVTLSGLQVFRTSLRTQDEFGTYEKVQIFVATVVGWSLVHVYETAREKAQDMLMTFATTDPLSGVFNRVSLEDKFSDAIKTAHRENKIPGFILIDLDNFKQINDSKGHPCGDEVLRQVAHSLQACVRQGDHVFRIGGEEFCILVSCDDSAHFKITSESVRQRIEAHRIHFEGEEVTVTCSIGAVQLRSDDKDLHAVLSLADKALYEAKENGKNRVVFRKTQLATV